MSYHLYFINLDNEVVKYGKSKRIKRRLNNHHRCFINKHKLGIKLNILKIFEFDNKNIYSAVERRITEYILAKNIMIKKYDNKELFLIEEYENFIELTKRFINSVIIDYELIDNINYREIPPSDVYNHALINIITQRNASKNIIGSIINSIAPGLLNNKNICLRCVNFYEILDNHIEKDTLCDGKYLDISYEDMKKII